MTTQGPPVGADPTALYPAGPPTGPPSAPPPLLPPVPGRGPGPSGESNRRRARRPAGVRTAIGVVLLFVAGLSATGAIAASWTRTQIRDEDTWAATSQALVDDPLVQRDVADALATQVIAATGAEDLLDGVLPGPLGGLVDPITEGATDLVSEAALQLVRTDAFVAAWDVAVRNSHEELLAAVDGRGRYTEISPEGIELDLGSTLEQFRTILDEEGLSFLNGIDLSGIDVQFLLVDAPGIERLGDLLEVLDTLVVVLPVVAGVAAVLGLIVARRRSWAIMGAGVGVLAGAAAVWLVVQGGSDRVGEEMAGGVLGPAAVDSVVDTVTASLERAMGVVAVVGVAVLIVGVAAAAVAPLRSRV